MILCKLCDTKQKDNLFLPKNIRAVKPSGPVEDFFQKHRTRLLRKIPKMAGGFISTASKEYLRYIQFLIFEKTWSNGSGGIDICMECIGSVREAQHDNPGVLKNLAGEMIRLVKEKPPQEGEKMPETKENKPAKTPAKKKVAKKKIARKKTAKKKTAKKRATKKPGRTKGGRKKFEKTVRSILSNLKDLKPLWLYVGEINPDERTRAKKVIELAIKDLDNEPVDIDFKL